jgi:flagellin
MLNRMYSLAEQSANGTYSNEVDREQLQKEVSKLNDEINRIADSSNFNGLKLLDGSLGDRSYEIKSPLANGIRAITATGGDGTAVDKAETLKVDLAASGKVTVAFATPSDAKVAGIKWEAVGADTVPADKQNGDAYITYKAVVDKTKALASAAARYDGMTVTVQVDRADSKGKYAADSQASVNLSAAKGLTLQIGDTADTFNQMTVAVQDIHTKTLGVSSVDISTQSGAQTAMGLIKNAINTVSDVRGGLGATQNRLEHTINNLSVMQENIQDAESTIRDTDVAAEMMKYTKNSILVQSAQAMLAQANQQPQGVLQLLQ